MVSSPHGTQRADTVTGHTTGTAKANSPRVLSNGEIQLLLYWLTNDVMLRTTPSLPVVLGYGYLKGGRGKHIHA